MTNSPNVGGFARAQAEYDAQMPPEYVPCTRCDDQGELDIACLYDVDGNPQEVPENYNHSAPCPWCPIERAK